MDIVQKFAALNQGGRLATSDADGTFRPAKTPEGKPIPANGKTFYNAVVEHLYHHQAIGVYPLTENDTVKWCGVDLDVGDHDSLIHAANLEIVLEQFGIKAWTELSRSKGAHTLVYLTSEIPAETARYAMLAACQIVAAPTTEIYPKQTSAKGGYGNGLRLAYPQSRTPGRQVVVDSDLKEIPLEDFVNEAYETAALNENLRVLADRYVRPKSSIIKTDAFRTRHTDTFGKIAKEIWDKGPKAGQDRSSMLVAFAASLLRQRFHSTDVEILVAECDIRWGQKYSKRADGAWRITELVRRTQAEIAQGTLL
jgi:hypothetical protein